MIRIEVENLQELKALLNLGAVEYTANGAIPTVHATEPAPIHEADHDSPDPNPVPFELAQPEKAVSPAPVQASVEAPKHNLVEVRAVLKELQDAKGKTVLKDLLAEFGVKAVSSVPEDKLDALYERAVELNA